MTATARQIQAAALFEAQGYPPESAAAFVGNGSQEVGPNLPTAFRGPPANLDHGSQGLMQWRLDRLTAYEAFVRTKQPHATGTTLWAWYGRLDYQVEFTALECRTKYPALQTKLMTGGNVATLTADICWTYERPAQASANLANRVKQAQGVFAASPHVTPVELQPQIGSTTTTEVNKTLTKQKATQKGAVGAAIISGAASVGVAASHVTWHIPTWGWVTISVLGVIVVLAVLAARKAAAAATTATTVLSGSPVTTESTMAPAKYPTHVPDSAGITAQAASEKPSSITTVAQLESGDTKVSPSPASLAPAAVAPTPASEGSGGAPVAPASPPAAPAPAPLTESVAPVAAPPVVSVPAAPVAAEVAAPTPAPAAGPSTVA